MWKKEKKTDKSESREQPEKLSLEKGDLPAMFIAAIISLGPYFLIMILTLFLLGWIFGAFR